MKGRVAPLAGREKFGGPIIPLKVRVNVAATIDPRRIAEAADRANRWPGKLAGSEHRILDRSDRASLAPTPPVIVALPWAGSPVSHGRLQACA